MKGVPERCQTSLPPSSTRLSSLSSLSFSVNLLTPNDLSPPLLFYPPSPSVVMASASVAAAPVPAPKPASKSSHSHSASQSAPRKVRFNVGQYAPLSYPFSCLVRCRTRVGSTRGGAR